MGICSSKDERRASADDYLNPRRVDPQNSGSHTYQPRSKPKQHKPPNPQYYLRLTCTRCHFRPPSTRCSRSRDLNMNRETRVFRDPSRYPPPRSPSPLKPWDLHLDLCGFNGTADNAVGVLQAWMRDKSQCDGDPGLGGGWGRRRGNVAGSGGADGAGTEDPLMMGKGTGPFCADGLIAALQRAKVPVELCHFGS
ncbi:hypothetical protein VTK26DRAFT_2465 [Humicola hyalothermophila]